MYSIKYKYCIVVLFVASTALPCDSKKNNSKKTRPEVEAKANTIEHGLSDVSIKCPTSKASPKFTTIQTKLIPLIDIESTDCTTNDVLSKENNNLFFIESSGRNFLSPRDTCAIESAIKNSGLAGHIIVAMTSPFLDVMANNATCHLYTEHEGKNVFFRHVNVDTIFKDTPIQELHFKGNLKHHEERKTIVQYADAIRIILVHRFGGWYSDLDMVFLRPFDRTKGGEPLQNVAASDGVMHFNYDKPSEKHNWGDGISNALFHNEAGHVFLETAIKVFNTTFSNGAWASSGPSVFTNAMDEICGQKNTKKRPLNPVDYGRNRCHGMTAVEPRLFYPYNWFLAHELTQTQLDDFWEEKFKKSYVVHFYGSSSDKHGVTKYLRPNNYGRKKPAYAYIGPSECPVSFYSTRPF